MQNESRSIRSWLTCAAVVMASAAWAEEPSPPEAPPKDESPYSWVSYSQDGSVRLEQKGKPNRTCAVTATREGKELWTAKACLGKRVDMRFVSNDGERVVVLHPITEGAGTDWTRTEVAHIYRRAKLDWAVAAGVVIKDPKKARISGAQVDWLKGTLATPGTPPRYKDDGSAVDFETVDGQVHSIPLVIAKKSKKK